MAATFAITPEEILRQATGAASIIHALHECSDELRDHAVRMLEILNDPETDSDERMATVYTVADLLFPNTHEGDKQLGIDLADLEKIARDPNNAHAVAAGTPAVIDAMDAEEATFAERLAATMREQNVTQTALAERVGLHQSAISMMLSRDCRPQKRTVTKLAAALGVEPAALWPGFAQKS